MAAPKGLVYSDGTPIRARDIAGIRARASLAGGLGTYGGTYAYDGAVPTNQNMSSWLPSVRSPDSEINYDRDRMVGRARDLRRNDPWAGGAIQRIADAAIGARFFPVPQPNWRVLKRKLGPKYDIVWAREFTSEAIGEWRMWADDPNHWCDVQRRQSITQMFYQALGTKLVEGDSLAMLPWMLDQRTPGAARYATCLQLIDPDRLSNPYMGVDTHQLRGGIEIDSCEAPIAYNIRRAHQYDYYDALASMTWDRFERETAWGRRFVIHDFDQTRATQHRGVSVFANLIERLRMGNRYDTFTLQGAFLRTIYGMYVKSPYDEGQIAAAMDAGYSADSGDPSPGSMYQEIRADHYAGNPIEMDGVRISTLAPGEDIGVIGGPAGMAENYETFQSTLLRSVAQSTGQSYAEVSNDFSKENYSSFRGASLQAWKTLIRRRNDFVTGTADPVYDGWSEEFCELNPDLLPAGFTHDDFIEQRAAFTRAKWIGPGRGWVDPLKERQGEVLSLDAAFGTLKDTCADISGEWWEDVIDQRQYEVQAFKDRNLKLPEVFQPSNATQDDVRPQPS